MNTYTHDDFVTSSKITARSHHLNQCWLITNGVLLHSLKTNHIPFEMFKISICKISLKKNHLPYDVHISQRPMSLIIHIDALKTDNMTKTKQRITYTMCIHDDVIKWKHFPRYWPFVRGIHRSPVNSPHKGQWRGALMFSLIGVWINGWLNNREAGD